MSWWHADYIYRRRLLVSAPNEYVSANHPVEINLGTKLMEHGKVRSDFEDIEIVYVDENGIARLLYRETELEEGELVVRFPLYSGLVPNADLSDSYHLYYGNLDLRNRPERPGFNFIDGGSPEITGELGELDGGEPSSVFGEDEQVDGGDPWTAVELKGIWPVTVEHDEDLISYTRPGEHWVNGVSDHALARATIQVACTRFRVISEIGPDKGIMEVQVNDGEWRRVDLYDPLVQLAPVIELALPSVKTNEIRLRVGQNSNPNSVGDEVNLVSIQYAKAILVEDLGEQVSDIVWSSSTGGVS